MYLSGRWLRAWVALGLLPVLVVSASFVAPIPALYMYLPGPVRDVAGLVKVSGERTYSSEGRLLMTTVGVDVSVSAADFLSAVLDRRKVLVPAHRVTGGRSLETLERVQRREMVMSKRHAREVALAAHDLGHPAGDGARVVRTVDGQPADGVLQAGDLITGIDGRRIDTSCDVGRAVEAAGVDGQLHLTVRRGDASEQVVLHTTSNAGTAYVGVEMRDVNYRFEPQVEVGFRTGDVAGPPAGLMFALALYDRLTAADLTGGRTVAGTGTIECDGGVGAIGGVEQKVAAAEMRDADIFLGLMRALFFVTLHEEDVGRDAYPAVI
jgi:Lon-like protease